MFKQRMMEGGRQKQFLEVRGKERGTAPYLEYMAGGKGDGAMCSQEGGTITPEGRVKTEIKASYGGGCRFQEGGRNSYWGREEPVNMDGEMGSS